MVTEGESPVGTIVGGVKSAFRSASDALSDALTFGLIPFSSRSAAAIPSAAQAGGTISKNLTISSQTSIIGYH